MKKKVTDLTIEELRKYKGLEQLTDDQAREAIDSIEKLAYIALKQTMRLMKEEEKKNKTNSR